MNENEYPKRCFFLKKKITPHYIVTINGGDRSLQKNINKRLLIFL